MICTVTTIQRGVGVETVYVERDQQTLTRVPVRLRLLERRGHRKYWNSDQYRISV